MNNTTTAQIMYSGHNMKKKNNSVIPTTKVIIGGYKVFGSGSIGCRFIIDSVDAADLYPEKDLGDNGFVGWIEAEIPTSDLIEADHVTYYKGTSPGGETSFKGTGKEFVRWYYNKGKRWDDTEYHPSVVNRSKNDTLAIPLDRLELIPRMPKTRRWWLEKHNASVDMIKLYCEWGNQN